MADTYDAELFYRDGRAMARYPDGEEVLLADVMRYMNPGTEFDDATGSQMAATPPRADAPGFAVSPPEEDRFGATAAYMAEPYFADAGAIMSEAGRRPTYFTDPVLGNAERAGQYLGDAGMAGLNALGGAVYGGAGLLGDIFGGTPQQERRLARDIAGGTDVAGVGPELRIVDALRRGGPSLLDFATDAGKAVAPTARQFMGSEFGGAPVPGSVRTQKVGNTTVQFSIADDGTAEIYSVRTPKDKRGGGSARSAMDAVLPQLRDEGATSVKLVSSPLDAKTNPARLKGFYESLGFRGTGETANIAGDPIMRMDFPVGAPAPAKNAFGQGWQDVYHWSRSPENFSQFDPNKSTSAMSQLGPHVGTPQAAEARYMGWSDADKTLPPQGFTLPLRADLSKPFLNPSTNQPWSEMDLEMFVSAVADANGVDRRSVAPIMRERLAREGYTSIPYLNDVEDAGSISNIMLTDRGGQSDAVLRSRFAAFDPRRARAEDLSAAITAGVPIGLLAMQPDQGPQ